MSDANMAVNDTDETGIRLDFSTGVTSLSLYGVDYGGSPSEIEIATLAAYDSMGMLLGSTTVQATRGSRTVESVVMPTDIAFLSLTTSTNISYAEFTYTNGSFFGIDDVEFSGVSVPEPSALLLFSLGVIGVAASRKKTTLSA